MSSSRCQRLSIEFLEKPIEEPIEPSLFIAVQSDIFNFCSITQKTFWGNMQSCRIINVQLSVEYIKTVCNQITLFSGNKFVIVVPSKMLKSKIEEALMNCSVVTYKKLLLKADKSSCISESEFVLWIEKALTQLYQANQMLLDPIQVRKALYEAYHYGLDEAKLAKFADTAAQDGFLQVFSSLNSRLKLEGKTIEPVALLNRLEELSNRKAKLTKTQYFCIAPSTFVPYIYRTIKLLYEQYDATVFLRTDHPKQSNLLKFLSVDYSGNKYRSKQRSLKVQVWSDEFAEILGIVRIVEENSGLPKIAVVAPNIDKVKLIEWQFKTFSNLKYRTLTPKKLRDYYEVQYFVLILEYALSSSQSKAILFHSCSRFKDEEYEEKLRVEAALNEFRAFCSESKAFNFLALSNKHIQAYKNTVATGYFNTAAVEKLFKLLCAIKSDDVSSEGYKKILLALLNQLISQEADPKTHVEIMTITEARMLNYDLIVACSLVDYGAYDHGLISPLVFSNLGVLTPTNESIAGAAYDFTALIYSGKNVILSYPKVMHGKTSIPLRWLLPFSKVEMQSPLELIYSTTFSNRSSSPQNFPAIKLVLTPNDILKITNNSYLYYVQSILKLFPNNESKRITFGALLKNVLRQIVEHNQDLETVLAAIPQLEQALALFVKEKLLTIRPLSADQYTELSAEIEIQMGCSSFKVALDSAKITSEQERTVIHTSRLQNHKYVEPALRLNSLLVQNTLQKNVSIKYDRLDRDGEILAIQYDNTETAAALKNLLHDFLPKLARSSPTRRVSEYDCYFHLARKF